MNNNLYRGSLDTVIIKLLSEYGEMYGYEITKKVREMTEGKLVLTEGALYPSLHKMEANELLTVETRFVDNRNRKYYKLTKKGKSELKILIDEMNEYIDTITNILNSKLA